MQIRVLSALILILLSSSLMAQKPIYDYAPQWKKIDELISKKGLPLAAEGEVDKLYAQAKKEGNTPQVMKALVYKMQIAGSREEEATPKQIEGLTKELAVAKEPEASLLHSLIATSYWQYLQQNRWKLYGRTTVQGATSADIATWSADDLHAEIAVHYQASIKNRSWLVTQNLDGYEPILQKGNSRNLRPTLYDLLAHQVLDYFTNPERDITKPAYAFTLTDAEAFASAEKFSTHHFVTKDTASLDYRAVLLYQDLTKQHLSDKDPAALIDLELERLEYMKRTSVREDKDERYRNAMGALAQRFPNRDDAAMATLRLLQMDMQEAAQFDPTQGKTTHRDGYAQVKAGLDQLEKEFPGSTLATQAYNLRQNILQPSLSVITEQVNTPGQPFRSLVTYKNVSHIYYRIIAADDALADENGDRYSDNYWKKAAGAKAISTSKVDLPQLGDYRVHNVEIKVDALPVGRYAILASASEDFSLAKNNLALSVFDVTSIGWFNNLQHYFILDRETGQPLPQAKVQVWQTNYDYNTRRNIATKRDLLTADLDGHIKIPTYDQRKGNTLFEVSWKQDHYYPQQVQQQYDYRSADEDAITDDARKYEENNRKVFFFTDRGIYRPGQTVHFKAIIVTRDFKTRKYRTVPDFSNTLKLNNANGEEIDSLTLTTNEFGSISGRFTLPQNVLTGEFSIATKEPGGQTTFRVEEYKRPKFYTQLNNPKGDYRLNDSISVTGLAKAYAGNLLNGAKVRYRVTRQSRFLDPIWFRGPWRPSPPQEITSGEIITSADGSYAITFIAIPDPSIPAAQQPVFDYAITVDVTDINGETRSASSNLSVGYQTLQLKVNIPSRETLNYTDSTRSIVVTASNLAGETQKIAYSLSAYKLIGPDRLIRSRYWEKPDTFLINREDYLKWFPHDEYADETDKLTWERSSALFTIKDSSSGKPITFPSAIKEPGWYLFEALSKDKYSNLVKAREYIQVFDRKSLQGGTKQYILNASDALSYEPGDKASFSLQTDADDLWVLQDRLGPTNELPATPQPTPRKEKAKPPVKIVSEQTDAQHPFTLVRLNRERKEFLVPVEESDRGGFGYGYAFIKHNRFFQRSSLVDIPWTNKQLDVRFKTFRDKTEPGSKEEWTVTVTGKKGEKLAAELLTSAYDASLDQFAPFSWTSPSLFPTFSTGIHWQSHAGFGSAQPQARNLNMEYHSFTPRSYDRLIWGNGYGGVVFSAYGMRARSAQLNDVVMADEEKVGIVADSAVVSKNKFTPPKLVLDAAPPNELQDVVVTAVGVKHPSQYPATQLRTNFNETAFFFPDLKTDAEGNVQFSFTMPEALTQWKAQVFAHTKDLAMGMANQTIVTRKELMVQPNAPRFLREGDRLSFSAKVANITDKELTGQAQLQLIDPSNGQPVDGWFKNAFPTQFFTVAAGQSKAVHFDIDIPNNYNKPLRYRILATSGNLSDGEEADLPVLSNRMLVTESMPILMKGDGTQAFSFDKLLKNQSPSLTHHALTVEYSANPAWYAVQALPYLAEFPHECAEQLFNRFYADALAEKVIEKAPTIKAYYAKWATDSSKDAALLSNLEKNSELKSVLLQETPWVLEAKNEAEQKKNIALLFDMARISRELGSSLEKLTQMQSPNGGFVWFPGGPDDRFITQYIASAIGHLQKLQAMPKEHVVPLTEMQRKAILYLDQRIVGDYNDLIRLKSDLKKHQLSSLQVQYLYARSMVKDLPLPEKSKTAYAFYLDQSSKFWLQHGKMEQAMIALVQHRAGNVKKAVEVITSLKQYAINSPTLGMYWKDVTAGYYWNQAPVETQALLIEAFAEVAKDENSVESMKQWLLTQKQTSSWKSTKATADAVYALLLQGQNWAGSTPEVSIKLGEKMPVLIQSSPTDQSGTGYFKQVVDGKSVTDELGKVQVTVKGTAGKQALSWGAVYWQYFENLDAITPAASPFSLKKKLYIETESDKGPVLKELEEGKDLKVGDKLIVRVELRADRDMEYVHMKDMRASGTEPVNVLSQYKWQGGLGYYESTRDASTNFFFSWLPKGTYVFEYPLFVSAEGNFSVGIAEAQCMYAPEFVAHSEGVRIRVRD